MATQIANWTLETTATTGTGAITLGGAIAGYATFADTVTSGDVYYVIEDGNDRESGIGNFNGTSTLTRTTVLATLVSGAYNDATPTAISLSGNATVGITITKGVYDKLINSEEIGQTINGSQILTEADEGPGNGIDADTLDGVEGSNYLRSDQSDTLNGTLTISDPGIHIKFIDSNGTDPLDYWSLNMNNANIDFKFIDNSAGTTKFGWQCKGNGATELMHSGSTKIATTSTGVAVTGSITADGNTVLTTADEGSGNGIDADTVDSLEAGQFLRSDQDDTINGTLSISDPDLHIKIYDSNGTDPLDYWSFNMNNANMDFKFIDNSAGTTKFGLQLKGNGATELMHNGSTKLATASTGVAVTGKVTSTTDVHLNTSSGKTLVGTTTDGDTGTGSGVGTHQLQVDGLVRTGDGFRDALAPFNAAKLGGVKDPGFTNVRDGLYLYGFDAATSEEVFVVYHFDHDIKPGSDFYMHVHWTPGNNTNTGTVRWGIEYSIAQGHSQDTFGASTTIYIEQAGSGTAYQHQVAESAAQSFANMEADTVIIARVFRDAAHANDTFNADAFGIMADIHYQTDRYSTLNRSPNFYT